MNLASLIRYHSWLLSLDLVYPWERSDSIIISEWIVKRWELRSLVLVCGRHCMVTSSTCYKQLFDAYIYQYCMYFEWLSDYICSVQELLELGEAVGTESRGLSQDLLSLLPISKYKCSFFSRKKSRSERYNYTYLLFFFFRNVIAFYICSIVFYYSWTV